MVPPGQWFSRKPLLALKLLTVYVHRSTLPQSASLPAPSGREPGNVPHNVNHPPAGCFVSGRVIFGGSVWGHFFHSTGYLRNRGGAGDFHRPYETLKFLSVYVHRTTLPQSRIRSTAPSEREPGQHPHNANHPPAGCCVSGRVIFWGSVWGYFYHSTGCLRNRGGAGDFHRPYEGSEIFTFHHSSGDTPSRVELVVVGLFLGVHGFVCFSGELFYGVGWVVCGEGAAGGEA